MRLSIRLALLGVVIAALLLLSTGAAVYAIVIVGFGVVLVVFDRLIPSTGSLSVDAQRAFNGARRRPQRFRRGEADSAQLELLVPAIEARASKRRLGIQPIAIDSIVGTLEPDRARSFDRNFSPPSWSRERWELMWIASRRGTSFPPISVYRIGDAHYVRDGHYRVSVARALGATEIDAEVTELDSPLKGSSSN